MNNYPRMDGKVCLVTGATSGIGEVTAATLAALGAEVVLVGRNPAKTEATLEKIRAAHPQARLQALLADFADLEQVRALAADFQKRYDRLDVLVNNAGAFFATRKPTPYGVEMTLLVNHLAPFLLTNLLLDALRVSPAGRVVNVASEAHRSGTLDWDNLDFRNGYSGMQAYARSKLANILFTRELAERLDGTGVTANALHPGVVATGIWRLGFAPLDRLAQWIVRFFMLSPEEGADTTLYLATDPAVADVTGAYFVKRKPVSPAPQAQDPDLARQLWEFSAEKVGLA